MGGFGVVKRSMSERDICKLHSRGKSKRADYVLYHNTRETLKRELMDALGGTS
jgi:hypothetical protein